MKTINANLPRVTGIEVHYEDGSTDVIMTVAKAASQIPLFTWERRSEAQEFQKAFTSAEVAGILFQTLLTRRMMPMGRLNLDTMDLLKNFAHWWSDPDYSSEHPNKASP